MYNHTLQIERSIFSNDVKLLIADVFKDELNKINNDECEITDFLSNLQKKIDKKIIPEVDFINKEIYKAMLNKSSFLSIYDKEYPEILKLSKKSPIIFAYKGDLSLLEKKKVAVVGSRVLDIEDFEIIKKIVKIFNDIDFIIVSGLAAGTDSLSHFQGVENGTIVVLPCGLNNCYPKENKYLLDKIIDNEGLVISIFPYNEEPKKYNFLKRNSIIADLSDSVVIGRAREIKCGTMSTANYAKQANKTIYTYNFKGQANGNKFLLQHKLATEIKDLEELKIDVIMDATNNDIKIDNLKKITNLRPEQSLINKSSNNLTNQLYNNIGSNISNNSIKNEIKNIIKCNNIKILEKNIKEIFDVCYSELRCNKKEILKNIIEIVFFDKHI